MAFTIPVYETLDEIAVRLNQASAMVQGAIQAVAAARTQDVLYRKLLTLPPAELTAVQELLTTLDDYCADAVELLNHTTLFSPDVCASKYKGIAYLTFASPATVGTIAAYDEDGVIVAAWTHVTAADTIEIVGSSLAANDGLYTVTSVVANVITLTTDLTPVAQDTTAKVILRAIA